MSDDRLYDHVDLICLEVIFIGTWTINKFLMFTNKDNLYPLKHNINLTLRDYFFKLYLYTITIHCFFSR